MPLAVAATFGYSLAALTGIALGALGVEKEGLAVSPSRDTFGTRSPRAGVLKARNPAPGARFPEAPLRGFEPRFPD